MYEARWATYTIQSIETHTYRIFSSFATQRSEIVTQWGLRRKKEVEQKQSIHNARLKPYATALKICSNSVKNIYFFASVYASVHKVVAVGWEQRNAYTIKLTYYASSFLYSQEMSEFSTCVRYVTNEQFAQQKLYVICTTYIGRHTTQQTHT